MPNLDYLSFPTLVPRYVFTPNPLFLFFECIPGLLFKKRPQVTL